MARRTLIGVVTSAKRDKTISKTKSFTLVKVIEKSRGSIKLKDEVSGETKEEAEEDDK